MTDSTIIYVQIGSLLAYIAICFGLYKLLVSSKDATIETLKERIEQLKEKLALEKDKTPEMLAERLATKIKLYEKELKELSQDKQANQESIKAKQGELEEVKKEFEALQKQMEDAQIILDEFLCPYCKATMRIRQYADYEYGDYEITIYDCGLELEDGREKHPCRHKDKLKF